MEEYVITDVKAEGGVFFVFVEALGGQHQFMFSAMEIENEKKWLQIIEDKLRDKAITADIMQHAANSTAIGKLKKKYVGKSRNFKGGKE